MDSRLLIFDLDGTLIDSRQDLCTGVNLMRRHYGLPPLPLATVTGYIGDGVRMLVTRALEGAAVDIEEAIRLNKQHYREHIHEATRLYPGVAGGLSALHAAGHRLALITNKPEEATRVLLRHFDIHPLFVRVIGGDSGYPLKPDPGAVWAAMQAAGEMRAADTWMVGDNHTDLEAGRRAGVNSVFVTYGFGRRGDIEPTLTVGSFAELVDEVMRTEVRGQKSEVRF